MLISFIITAYNLPKGLLRKCIESILSLSIAQDEYEIILIDDGSKHSVQDEIVGIEDKVLFFRQKNSGLSAARNKGIELANGEYIQFVDGDDSLIPHNYMQCVSLLKENPDIVTFKFTSGGTRWAFSSKKPFARKLNEDSLSASHVNAGSLTGTAFLQHNNLRAAAWSYIFKKNILAGLRFTPGIFHEDEEFTPLLFLHANDIITTDVVAYYYRQRQGSIVSSRNKEHTDKRLRDFFYVVCHLYYVAGHLPVDEKEALQRRVAQLSMDYIYNVIKLKHSYRYLENTITRMREKGLFPLPKHNYTYKYSFFRIVSRSKAGRFLATIILGWADI